MNMHEEKVMAVIRTIRSVYTDISVDINVTISDLEKLKDTISDYIIAAKEMKDLE